MSYEFFVSSRYLRAKQKHTFISLITILSIAGVTVGVMALIIVIGVMAGFESDLKSRILGVESHLVLMRRGFSEYRETLEYLQDVDGVESATPFVYTQIMLRSSAGLSGAVLRGIDPVSAGRVIKKLDKASLAELENRKSEANAKPGIILGKELAKNLGVAEGDSLYLISPRGMISPMGLMPAMKRFQVTGLFQSGM